MSKKVFLRIGQTVFAGDLLPDMVMPSVEIVKNEERSINGTMNVDIVARKVKLEISWSFLDATNMAIVTTIAEKSSAFEVTYTDAKNSEDNTITAYVSNLSYTPYFVGDKINWKDVKLELNEI